MMDIAEQKRRSKRIKAMKLEPIVMASAAWAFVGGIGYWVVWEPLALLQLPLILILTYGLLWITYQAACELVSGARTRIR